MKRKLNITLDAYLVDLMKKQIMYEQITMSGLVGRAVREKYDFPLPPPKPTRVTAKTQEAMDFLMTIFSQEPLGSAAGRAAVLEAYDMAGLDRRSLRPAMQRLNIKEVPRIYWDTVTLLDGYELKHYKHDRLWKMYTKKPPFGG